MKEQVFLVIDSPEDQEIKIQYFSLGNDFLSKEFVKIESGVSRIELSERSFVKKHIYFKVQINSPYKLKNYSIQRRS